MSERERDLERMDRMREFFSKHPSALTESKPVVLETRVKELRDLRQRLLSTNKFQEGQIVRWKPGLRNRLRPGYDEPAIVTQILEGPVTNPSEEAGTPYFRERLDLVLGLFSDDDFVEYYFDSRRFEPYPDLKA